MKKLKHTHCTIQIGGRLDYVPEPDRRLAAVVGRLYLLGVRFPETEKNLLRITWIGKRKLAMMKTVAGLVKDDES